MPPAILPIKRGIVRRYGACPWSPFRKRCAAKFAASAEARTAAVCTAEATALFATRTASNAFAHDLRAAPGKRGAA